MHDDGNHRWTSGAFFLMTLMLLCGTCQADSKLCVFGQGASCDRFQDVVVHHGTDAALCCSLLWSTSDTQPHDERVSDLEILIDNESVESERMNGCLENSIAFSLKKLPPSKFTFTCRLRSNDIGRERYEVLQQIKVYVGSKPEKPRYIECTSLDWEKLMCMWEPVPNNVTTTYSLWSKPARNGLSLPCPVPQEEYLIPMKPNICVWNASTYPLYSPNTEYLTFVLNAQNALGSENFTYRFRQWERVIPLSPVNLSVHDITPSSALLHWSVPIAMQNFPPGWHYRVSYQKDPDSVANWQTIVITNETHATDVYFNLPNLEFNTAYNVRVFIRSSLAVGENLWGMFSDITFTTSVPLPLCSSPRIDRGSFEIIRHRANRDIYIYWQPIHEHLENGDDFPYRVVNIEENGQRLNLRPHEINKTYAMFKGISFNDWKFEIIAADCRGRNDHKATVYIPRQLEAPRKPTVFTKIAYSGGVYELSWSSPRNSDIIDYTIFRCKNDRDRPYQCHGYLDWVHVPGNINIYNTTVPDPTKVYQFAIAANTERASSGMVWFSAETTIGEVVGKVKSLWINRVESDSVEIAWKLADPDRIGMVEGFHIHYCQLLTLHDCKDPEMNTVRANLRATYAVVNGLEPDTRYKLSFTILSENGEGLHSNALYFTTTKAAPDSLRESTTTPAETVSESITVAPSTTVITRIEQTSSSPDAFSTKMYQGDEDLDRKPNRIDELNSKIDSFGTQVSSLTRTVSALEAKLDSLSDENRQLRENISRCCGQRSFSVPDIPAN